MIPSYTVDRLADLDLDEISDFIAGRNMEAALRFLRAVYQVFADLSRMPAIGRREEMEHAGLTNLRVWHVPGFNDYLIFYTESTGGIEIHRVLHGARDVRTALHEAFEDRWNS